MNGYEASQYDNFGPYDSNESMQFNGNTFKIADEQQPTLTSSLNPLPYLQNKLEDVYNTVSDFNPIDSIKNANLSQYYASSDNDDKLRKRMSPDINTEFIEDSVNSIKNNAIKLKNEIVVNPNTKLYFLIAFLLIIIVIFYCKK